MFGVNRQHDLELIKQLNENGNLGKNSIKNEDDYDNFIRIKNNFEEKEGKYNQYMSVIPGKFVYFFYKNLRVDYNKNVIILNAHDFKKNYDVLDLNIYVRNKIIYNNNLIFIINKSYGKYIDLFLQLFINYGNDIKKNAKNSLIFYMYKVYKSIYILKNRIYGKKFK